MLHLVVDISEEELEIVELQLLLALVAFPLLLRKDLLQVAVAPLAEAIDAAKATLAQRAVDFALIERLRFGTLIADLSQVLRGQIAIDIFRVDSLKL